MKCSLIQRIAPKGVVSPKGVALPFNALETFTSFVAIPSNTLGVISQVLGGHLKHVGSRFPSLYKWFQTRWKSFL